MYAYIVYVVRVIRGKHNPETTLQFFLKKLIPGIGQIGYGNQTGDSEALQKLATEGSCSTPGGRQGEGSVPEAQGLELNGRNWIDGEDAAVARELPRQREKERNIVVSSFLPPSHWPDLTGSSGLQSLRLVACRASTLARRE